MKPFLLLATSHTPDGAELTLHAHDSNFYLRVNRQRPRSAVLQHSFATPTATKHSKKQPMQSRRTLAEPQPLLALVLTLICAYCNAQAHPTA